jgi:hypothetical protein
MCLLLLLELLTNTRWRNCNAAAAPNRRSLTMQKLISRWPVWAVLAVVAVVAFWSWD